MRSSLLWLLPLLVSTVAASSTPCGGPPDRLPAWACVLCGPNTDQCLPYNATFDELQAGTPVGNYNDISWRNFQVETPAKSPSRYHINAFSPKNYARLPANKRGVLQSNYGILLTNFHYGCTDPWLGCESEMKDADPRSCVVTLTAYCGYARGVAMPQQWAWNYTVGQPSQYTNLSYTNGNSYLGPGYGACANYTFSARSPSGGMVDLFLDDVIYKRVTTW